MPIGSICIKAITGTVTIRDVTAYTVVKKVWLKMLSILQQKKRHYGLVSSDVVVTSDVTSTLVSAKFRRPLNSAYSMITMVSSTVTPTIDNIPIALFALPENIHSHMI